MISRLHNNDNPQTDTPTPYEILLASLFFLMTRYARQPDDMVLRGIHDHLQRLARHAEGDSAFLSRTCERLLDQWLDITAQNTGNDLHQSTRLLLADSILH